jgi:hypothetical protein
VKFNDLRFSTIAAGLTFIGALVLTFLVSPFFIILAAIAAFTPDLLRLLGVVSDVDEFQQEAAGKASRLAMIVTAIFIGCFYAFTATGIVDSRMQRDAWLLSFTLLVATRYIAYAAMYWDAQRGAPRIFLAFGAFWALFVIFSEWGKWIALVMEGLVVVVPFIAAALLVRRFPRSIGGVSIAGAVAAFVFFDLFQLFLGDLGSLVVFALISMPLLVTGIGLLTKRGKTQDYESTHE